jgi:hypothetical protein
VKCPVKAPAAQPAGMPVEDVTGVAPGHVVG